MLADGVRATPARPIKDQTSMERGCHANLTPGKSSRGAETSNGISPLQQSRGLEGISALSVETGFSLRGSSLASQPLSVGDAVVMAPKPVRIMSPRVLNSDMWKAASYDQYAPDDISGLSSDGRVSEPTSRDSDIAVGVESMFNLYQQHDYNLDSSHWLEGGSKVIDEDLTPRRCSNPLRQALDSIQTK